MFIRLLFFAAVSSITIASTSKAAGPRVDEVIFVTSPVWYQLEDKLFMSDPPALVFRQFAVSIVDGQAVGDFPNVHFFACQRDYLSYFTVHIPPQYLTRKLKKSDALPKTTVSAKFDGATATFPAEIRTLEAYMDLTDKTSSDFSRVFASSDITWSLGPTAERVSVAYHTPKGDVRDFIDGVLEHQAPESNFGRLRRFGFDEMLYECEQYKSDPAYVFTPESDLNFWTLLISGAILQDKTFGQMAIKTFDHEADCEKFRGAMSGAEALPDTRTACIRTNRKTKK